jgi:Tfp pilus assembly PilM family ATPase
VADVLIALTLMLVTLAAGAYLGHVIRACPYQKALTRVLDAAENLDSDDLDPAIDAAAKLLGRPR